MNAALAMAAALSCFDLSTSSSKHNAQISDMIRHPPLPLGRRSCTKGWYMQQPFASSWTSSLEGKLLLDLTPPPRALLLADDEEDATFRW